MLELQDTDSHNGDGDIANGESVTLTVDTHTAEYVEMLVDDGGSGNPLSYDVVVEYYSTALGEWMRADEAVNSTEFNPTVTKNARGQKYRATFTNSSGGSTNYRISLESFKQV